MTPEDLNRISVAELENEFGVDEMMKFLSANGLFINETESEEIESYEPIRYCA